MNVAELYTQMTEGALPTKDEGAQAAAKLAEQSAFDEWITHSMTLRFFAALETHKQKLTGDARKCGATGDELTIRRLLTEANQTEEIQNYVRNICTQTAIRA